MKHLQFDSIYRPDFQVVEQRQGRTTLYPHTDQLAVLYRALRLEFLGGLPPRYSRADHRADGPTKIGLRLAALMFCGAVNDARTDGLRLFQLVNRHGVATISIAQQITEETRKGRLHRFRFYAGQDFFPEIYLNGKRVAFTEHALERFSSRVPNPIGADLSVFIMAFFGAPLISAPVGPGLAFVVDYLTSILALTYKETESDFIVTTCLTINEINSMRPELPPHACNLHYDLPFTLPRLRNWIPTQQMQKMWKRYQSKAPLPPPVPRKYCTRQYWHRMASTVPDHIRKLGYGPGSQVTFVDDLPGPLLVLFKPGVSPKKFDELTAYKTTDSGYDWDTIFARELGLTPEQAEQYLAVPPVPPKADDRPAQESR